MRNAVIVVSILCGCGSDPAGVPAGGAGRFDGTWQVSSATLPAMGQLADAGARDAGAGTMTLTRTSTPLALRADYSFAATDATHGRWLGRLGVLRGDAIVDVAPMDGAVTIDGDAWMVAGSVATVVYSAALSGDALTLTHDPADPRNLSPGDPPRVLVLERVAAPPALTVGKWKVLDVDLEGLTIHGDTCTRTESAWVRLEIAIEIDARHLMERTSTVTTYSERTCTTVAHAPSVSRAKGLLEESAGKAELWSQTSSGDGDHATFTLTTPAAGRLELRRICAPAGCERDYTRLLLQKTD